MVFQLVIWSPKVTFYDGYIGFNLASQRSKYVKMVYNMVTFFGFYMVFQLGSNGHHFWPQVGVTMTGEFWCFQTASELIQCDRGCRFPEKTESHKVLEGFSIMVI